MCGMLSSADRVGPRDRATGRPPRWNVRCRAWRLARRRGRPPKADVSRIRADLGWSPRNEGLLNGVSRIKKMPPGASNNMYYYYYATQVMHHYGGEAWSKWNAGMRDALVDTQDQNEKTDGLCRVVKDHLACQQALVVVKQRLTPDLPGIIGNAALEL